MADFDRDASKTLVSIKMRDEKIGGLLGSSEEEVDSIWTEQNRAFEACFCTDVEDRFAQFVSIWKVDEAISSDVDNHENITPEVQSRVQHSGWQSQRRLRRRTHLEEFHFSVLHYVL